MVLTVLSLAFFLSLFLSFLSSPINSNQPTNKSLSLSLSHTHLSTPQTQTQTKPLSEEKPCVVTQPFRIPKSTTTCHSHNSLSLLRPQKQFLTQSLISSSLRLLDKTVARFRKGGVLGGIKCQQAILDTTHSYSLFEFGALCILISTVPSRLNQV